MERDMVVGTVKIRLGDVICQDIDKTGPTGTASEDFTYVDISSIDRDSKKITDAKKMLVSDAPSRAKQRLQAGDVLVSMTRPNLNAVAMVPHQLEQAIGSTGFHVIRTKHIDSKFIFHLGSVAVSHGQPKEGTAHSYHAFVISLELVEA